MNDTTLIHQWNRCQQVAKENHLKIGLVGDSFSLEKPNGSLLGMFRSILELYSFILGFDLGKQEPK